MSRNPRLCPKDILTVQSSHLTGPVHRQIHQYFTAVFLRLPHHLGHLRRRLFLKRPQAQPDFCHLICDSSLQTDILWIIPLVGPLSSRLYSLFFASNHVGEPHDCLFVLTLVALWKLHLCQITHFQTLHTLIIVIFSTHSPVLLTNAPILPSLPQS